jgi:hypothetical protein
MSWDSLTLAVGLALGTVRAGSVEQGTSVLDRWFPEVERKLTNVKKV